MLPIISSAEQHLWVTQIAFQIRKLGFGLAEFENVGI
jgi:hypothetical protein